MFVAYYPPIKRKCSQLEQEASLSTFNAFVCGGEVFPQVLLLPLGSGDPGRAVVGAAMLGGFPVQLLRAVLRCAPAVACCKDGDGLTHMDALLFLMEELDSYQVGGREGRKKAQKRDGKEVRRQDGKHPAPAWAVMGKAWGGEGMCIRACGEAVGGL